jgi:hypothetical protein
LNISDANVTNCFCSACVHNWQTTNTFLPHQLEGF